MVQNYLIRTFYFRALTFLLMEIEGTSSDTTGNDMLTDIGREVEPAS